MLQLIDGDIHLPALTSAHSHAFQRGMRGRAQRPSSQAVDFWSWRTAMYELAASLTPESLYQMSRIAYEELRLGGVRTVGEFHYVHHQLDGTPYEDRLQLAEAAIEAARAEKLRICLVRVIYHRAGAGRPAEGVQRRFSDASLDVALRDVDELWTRYDNQPDVRIAIAAHSVRAVPPDWLAPIAAFAERRKIKLHMHVAEQPGEVDACKAETGKRPVELLADSGVLTDRFVAVHCTHITDTEARLLGQARSFVCLCPTTERDLGDGLPDAGGLYAAGVRFCVGVDSHVLTSPLEDLRGIELGERLRTGKRAVLRPPAHTTPAAELWRIGSEIGAAACGFEDSAGRGDPGGTVRIDRAAPELSLVPDDYLLDAIVFSGTDRVFLQR